MSKTESNQKNKYIPLNIKYLRELKNISKSELGRRVGMKPQSMRDYEEGKSLPQIHTLLQLCEILEIDMHSIATMDLSKESPGQKFEVPKLDVFELFVKKMRDLESRVGELEEKIKG